MKVGNLVMHLLVWQRKRTFRPKVCFKNCLFYFLGDFSTCFICEATMNVINSLKPPPKKHATNILSQNQKRNKAC